MSALNAPFGADLATPSHGILTRVQLPEDNAETAKVQEMNWRVSRHSKCVSSKDCESVALKVVQRLTDLTEGKYKPVSDRYTYIPVLLHGGIRYSLSHSSVFQTTLRTSDRPCKL